MRLPWDPKVDLALAKTQPRAGKTFLAVTAILQEPEKAKSADALCEAFLGERRLVGTAHNAYSSAGVLRAISCAFRIPPRSQGKRLRLATTITVASHSPELADALISPIGSWKITP